MLLSGPTPREVDSDMSTRNRRPGQVPAEVVQPVDSTLAEKKGSRRSGRPRTPLPDEATALVTTLADFQCTAEEIRAALEAAGYKIGLRTLWRNYGTLIKARRCAAKATLRRVQWEKALSGNVSMLIWLGKNELGQRDNPTEPTSWGTNAIGAPEGRPIQYTVLFGQRIEF